MWSRCPRARGQPKRVFLSRRGLLQATKRGNRYFPVPGPIAFVHCAASSARIATTDLQPAVSSSVRWGAAGHMFPGPSDHRHGFPRLRLGGRLEPGGTPSAAVLPKANLVRCLATTQGWFYTSLGDGITPACLSQPSVVLGAPCGCASRSAPSAHRSCPILLKKKEKNPVCGA